MCIETYTRYLRCTHTQLQRWDYCAILIPTDRIPSTGRSCRKYKLRYKDTYNNDACFECLRERAIAEATGAVLPDRGGMEKLPARGTFARNHTFSKIAGGTVMGNMMVEKRGGKDSEGSLARSDGPGSPVKVAWEKDEEGGGQGEDKKKKKGIKGWFKQILQGNDMDRTEAEAMVFQFQRMDA
ncbi:hypothetical protein PTTW11_08798 [Pyrenophora teres f. teres]|uniref:Uncharacterized protein n=1 Tax=Pyrenophora teres f. teres TaxID=97479 RepID=A0A6S6WBB2_9PLEO|nr:hypothetical protein PTNB29_06911 [Pyrenophora teres f. teres]CAE7201189.1 hypothetical protein PTTW11_08798 [Pyrenophora teres f. teres]